MTATFDEPLHKHLDKLDSYVPAEEAERFRGFLAGHHPSVVAERAARYQPR